MVCLGFAVFFGMGLISSLPAFALDAAITVAASKWYASHLPAYGGLTPTRAYAPLPVFFEGWASTPRAEIMDYTWDFGDGSPAFHGFNTAHVFENPGIYTVTLTVTDNVGATNDETIQIEALARDGVTYYVDAALGNDANPGTGPGTDAWKTATHALRGMATTRYKPGDQVLFKRGQTFELDTPTVEPAHGKAGHSYRFATYGAGPKPVIQHVGSSNAVAISQTGHGLAHFTIQDLEFRMTSSSGARAGELFYATQEADDLLFLRLDFYDFSRAITISGGTTTDIIHGVFIIGCTTHTSEMTHVYAIASRYALLDNVFDLSGNHIAYLEYLDKAVIANNQFLRPAFGRTALRVSGNVGGSATPTNNVQISDNVFRGWIDPETDGLAHNGGGTRYNYQLINLCSNGPTSQFMTDVVFERNVVTNAETLVVIGDYDNLTLRNNLFTSASNSSAARIHIGLQPWDQKPLSNIRIIGNTVVSAAANGTLSTPMFGVYDYVGPVYFGKVDHENIEIKNNIVQALSGNGRMVYVDTTDPACLAAIHTDGNLYFSNTGGAKLFQVGGYTFGGGELFSLPLWQAFTGNDAASRYGDPLFVDLLGVDGAFSGLQFDEDLRVLDSSPAIDHGLLLPNLETDHTRNLRPAGAGPDIGAFEQSVLLHASVSGEGSVVVSPPLGHVLGQTIVLLAVAQPGWVFAGWSGDLNGIVNPQSLLLDTEKTVQATFTQLQPRLEINVIGDGTVAKNPTPPYILGTPVTLSATTSFTDSFLGWSGDLTDSENPVVIIMDGDKTVNARFTEDDYQVTVNVHGSGAVDVSPSPPYEYEDGVTLTATPAPGWLFAGWGGDATGDAAAITVSMTQHLRVSASFTDAAAMLYMTVVGPGQVLRSPAPPYLPGDWVNLTAEPGDGGAIFLGWRGSGLAGTATNQALYMNDDKVVFAYFGMPGDVLPSLQTPFFTPPHVERDNSHLDDANR
ncbi:MAG: PKD domain-containing protein [Candidatus Hydrogenedentes bacterium]|nr:PKD domain-containing protein [Candidatus Hydrogenedentota bacterium]